MDPILFFANLLFPNGDWKNIIATKGLEFAKAELRNLMHSLLFDAKAGSKSQVQKIAAKMQAENWTWDSTDSRVTSVPDEGLGRGFVLSRDALYRLIKAVGTPGGAVRDAWRDSLDNRVYQAIQAQVPAGTPLEAVVSATAEEFINKTLGHA